MKQNVEKMINAMEFIKDKINCLDIADKEAEILKDEYKCDEDTMVHIVSQMSHIKDAFDLKAQMQSISTRNIKT